MARDNKNTDRNNCRKHGGDSNDDTDDLDDSTSDAVAVASTEHAEPAEPAQPDEPNELSLLTLNCWGLPECWVADDYRAIREATRQLLPHGKLYRAGPFGAGLAILSRWQLEETSMRRFPLNGRPTAFWRGDWYVGKGVACATVRAGRQIVHVFNTHTHAPYGEAADESYACHRAAQAWGLAKLLRTAAAGPGQLVIALGDFNMLPLSLAHRIVTAGAPVRDVWRVVEPLSSLGPADDAVEVARGRPVPSAGFNLAVNGATSDGAYNTWCWTRKARSRLRAGLPSPVDADSPDPRGKRLDYIFASFGRPDAARGARAWVVKAAAVALTERHPDLHVSLSDHFAVHATLALHAPSPPGRAHAYDAQLAAPPADETRLPLATYDEMLAMIDAYTARERRQRRWRALHFHLALTAWAAALGAVFCVGPHPWIAFLLALAASLILAAGLIDGLLALLFFSDELRSLAEFRWEVRNARRAARAVRPLLESQPRPILGLVNTPDLAEGAVGRSKALLG